MKKWKLLGMSILAISFFLLSLGNGVAAEQKFPTKPIQVIIPFAPGDTDNLLRPFAEKMPEYLGQPVNFVYKPGAAGSLGTGLVASAKPDGYTLLGASQSCLTIVPHLQKDLSYTYESFAPITCLVDSPILLLTKFDSRWKSLKEMVAEAKNNPEKINYTSAGTFNVGNIAHEAFAKQARIKFNFIPSQGSGPCITAVLGGHVDLASAAIAPALPHLKAGTLRALAIYSEKRSQALPDVPTFTEAGYPVAAPVNYGFLAPKGTPREVIEKIHWAAQKILADHAAFVRDRLDKFGAQVGFMEPGEYAAFLKSQYDFYGNMIKAIKQ